MPMIVFFTCSQCKACVDFRGYDGKPSDNKPFKTSLIRKLLSGSNESTNGKKLKCSRIINIHDNYFGTKIDNIYEFIIYSLIPSNLVVTDDLIYKLMEDENQIIGDSILRIAIIRNQLNDRMEINVEFDGNENDHRCNQIKELVEEFFIWNHIPIEFKELRDYFRNNSSKNIRQIISDQLREDEFYDVLLREYYNYENNYNNYENDIKNKFDFKWFIKMFFPPKIRDLESFYPSWLLILPSEWGKGISGDKVYAKVKFCNTILEGTKFSTKKINNETMEDIIIQYYSGRISLNYEESMINTQENKTKRVQFSLN